MEGVYPAVRGTRSKPGEGPWPGPANMDEHPYGHGLRRYATASVPRLKFQGCPCDPVPCMCRTARARLQVRLHAPIIRKAAGLVPGLTIHRRLPGPRPGGWLIRVDQDIPYCPDGAVVDRSSQPPRSMAP